jgi:hypothetical protein
MKKIFLVTVIATAFAFALIGQTKSIYFEALGASNVAGITYDARFIGNSGFGYRIGLGYTFGFSNSSFIGGSQTKLNGLAIPVAINYLFGERKNHLELGFGMSNGIYQQTNKYGPITYTDANGNEITYPASQTKETIYGYFFFGDIGYRFQPAKGMMFRVGISPSFNFKGNHSVDKSFIYPYLSIGYAF